MTAMSQQPEREESTPRTPRCRSTGNITKNEPGIATRPEPVMIRSTLSKEQSEIAGLLALEWADLDLDPLGPRHIGHARSHASRADR